MVARGHVRLPGVCMVAGGACMVARRQAWLLGGMCGCQGACVVAGSMHGCRGACMVAREHAWLPGGCMVVGGGMHRIRRDTVNERAVRILLECILFMVSV